MKPVEPECVVIGASAGAFDALLAILPALPAGFRLPVIVVVHIPPGKRSLLADIFRSRCRLSVGEAEDKEPIRSGMIYFAPPDYHLLVERDKSLSLSRDAPILFSRPSIDVLFESAAEAYGLALIAVVLTGGNQDGALGLSSVKAVGGTALVQDPREAFAPAMPEAALRVCPDAHILSLDAIARYLREV
ncbi:MAG: chemotaxis protein CheB [Rhizobiales bacterium]|nr:chemotaxis protein CheB [Hyphomicrobiales bacterium]OJY05018.1 MAG: chemotaxis protein CheB [Rhizobiales bacterium 63-22]